jgi:outer membrane protein OmpA-like peptidoglycan-associated protein
MNGRDDTDGCPDAGLTPTTFEVKDPVGARVAGATLEIVSGPETGKYALGSGTMTRSLPPGRYRVRASADGYVEAADDLVVPDAARHAESLTIKPALAGGLVTVEARDPSGRPLSALVTVIGSPGRKFVTGPDGTGDERMAEGSYELSVWSEGYQPERVRVEVRKGEAARVSVTLQPSRVQLFADRLEIRDKVFFELDSATIKPESFRILDDVTAALDNHPEVQLVEVQGHTDDQGAEDYNLALSQRRADAVRQYLIANGVAAERLVAKGYGETMPLQPGTSEDARETNRRVAFRILKSQPVLQERTVAPAPEANPGAPSGAGRPRGDKPPRRPR